MPSTSIEVGSNHLFHVKEDHTSDKELISNFSIEVLGSVHVHVHVHVSQDAGGSGLLIRLKRYPDDTER